MMGTWCFCWNKGGR